MSWRCCKDTDSRNKINCQIIFRIFKRSKNTSSFSPAVKMAPSAAGEFAFVLLVSGCGQKPGVAPAAERGAEQSRAGRQRWCGDGNAVSVGCRCWWHKSPATEKPLAESCAPTKLGRCSHSPVPAAEPGLVALPVAVPMVALPSPFLPWWDRRSGMLSSDPSDPCPLLGSPEHQPSSGGTCCGAGLGRGLPPSPCATMHREITHSKYI